jgi:hypothetical protein
MTRDPTELFDNRRPVNTHWTPVEMQLDFVCPWLDQRWRGPTNPFEARIADDCMVALGTLLAQRQFSNHYDTDAIYRAMRGIRKA